MTTVGLRIMVKDEAKVIERCLRSVRRHITSWVVQDTGSSDGTPDIIREVLSDVPGEVYEKPFENFGENRTHLLSYRSSKQLTAPKGAGCSCNDPLHVGPHTGVRPAHYFLVLDADMEVVRHAQLSDLQADAYMLAIEEANLNYRLPLLVSSHRCWRYEGVTHEYLTSDAPFVRAPLDAWSVRHHHDGGTRAHKFTRDRALLEATFDARNIFYLAQTYEGQGYIQAAADLYGARAALAGWDEEAFYARFKQGALLRDPAILWQAYNMRPTRAEPLMELASIYRERGAFTDLAGIVAEGREIDIPDDVLFVHTDCYGEAAWSVFGV